MRPLLLLFVATGCGRVVVNAVPVDAAELLPDAAPGTCPQHIADPMPPQWFARADFDVVNDPAGTKGQVTPALERPCKP